MEIILKEDIIGLGYKNDIVNVKSGYGRNYLIPQGKAVIEAEKKGEAIKDVALCIAAKVSATGQLYGSVNAGIVAEELKKLGHDIDRKIITMTDAKTVGDYVATVHFHKEVEIAVPVKVVAENAAAEEKKEEAPVAEAPVEAPAVEEAPATEE